MQYHLLLFDADGTLLDFDRAEEEALKRVFLEHGLTYSPATGRLYHEINDFYWKQLELGLITREQLQSGRFRRFLEELGSPLAPAPFSRRYRHHLSECDFLFPGALELCETLHKNHSMAIVTNGSSEVQQKRLALSGIIRHFDKVYISEEIGWQKPHKAFFDFVLTDLEITEKKQVLLIGDSLTSDIQGGINAEIDTCWFQPSSAPGKSPATYQAASYADIFALLV